MIRRLLCKLFGHSQVIEKTIDNENIITIFPWCRRCTGKVLITLFAFEKTTIRSASGTPMQMVPAEKADNNLQEKL